MRLNSYALCALFCVGTAFTLGTLGTAGCADDQIGRPCNSLNRAPANGVSFVNPAPDCPTRLCMVTPSPGVNGGTGHSDPLAICTAECDTDSDCGTSSDFTSDPKRCGKYVCAVPSVVPGEENFCCKKLCVCADDLIGGFNKDDPRGGPHLPRDASQVAIPSACTKPNRCQLPK